MRQSPTLHLLALLAGALLALAAAGCASDPESESPPRLQVEVQLPLDADLAVWHVTQLRVGVQGEDLQDGARWQKTFPVTEAKGALGQLPEVPYSEVHERVVVVEGLDDEQEVKARGQSLPLLLTPDHIPPVKILLAPLEQFTYTVSYEDEGRADMHQPRTGHSTTLLRDGRVLVAGGVELQNGSADVAQGRLLDTIEIYDPADGRWHLSSTRLFIARAHHTATLMQSGAKILIVGGFGMINSRLTTLALPEVISPEKLDGPSGVTPLSHSPMFVPRARHTAVAFDDWVLVAGGVAQEDGGTPYVVGELELFFTSVPDPLLDGDYCQYGSWTFCRTDEMVQQVPRVGHGATNVGNFILLFGGSNGQTTLRSSEHFSYDSKGEELPRGTRSGPELVQARQDMSWVNYNDQVFVFGGELREAGSEPRALATIEWYDPRRPTSEQWQAVAAPIGAPRAESAAVLLGTQGWVLVAGGRGSSGSPVPTALELQIGPTGVVEAPSEVAGTLRVPRFGHALSLLPTGQVLVTGGTTSNAGSSGSLAVTEIFTPYPELLH